jgi:hypothetical protein
MFTPQGITAITALITAIGSIIGLILHASNPKQHPQPQGKHVADPLAGEIKEYGPNSNR